MTTTKKSKLSYKSIAVVILSLLFSLASGIILQDWLVGGAVLFSGLLSAYFASIGKRINYVFGLINYLLMGYIAFRNHLYGTGSFYVFACSPLQIQGFISWSKNLDDTNVKVRKFNAKISILVISACIAGSVIIGLLLSLIPSQQLSFLDAAANCVNLCGLILMNLRYMEAWWLWLVNNVLDLTIWTWILFTGGGANVVMMFMTSVMYLIVNIYGIWKWMKNSKIEKKASKA